MEPAVKVFVVHNRPLFYEGIRAVLESAGGFTMVGAAIDVDEALRRCSNLEVDVFLVDFHNAEASFSETVRRLASTFSAIPVVVLSSRCSPHCIRRATALGAKGFVGELSPTSELPRALKAAAAGNYFFDPETAKELVGMVSAISEESLLHPDEGYRTLTKRERQVFHMLADGLSNKEIAFELGISRKTVETHHLRISRKLGTYESVDLLRYAARLGILELQ